MSDANESLVLRWARWQTRALARVWPEESRGWGEAIASEAEAIEQPMEALGWALGGVTVYVRALGTHFVGWMKMPVGQRGGGTVPLAGAPGPKRSRLFAVVVLACAAGLLCLPEGREAIRTLRSVWEDFAGWDADQRDLRSFATAAEKNNDAQMMAFVALSLRDGNKMELVERAVALDPQLVWIYAAAAHQYGESGPGEAAEPKWLATAEAADSGNAVPYLLGADEVGKSPLAKEGDQRAPTEPEIGKSLTSNAQWVALMHKAFEAPRYDSYYRRHRELNREIWRREPQLPFTSAFEGLWMHSIPNLFDLGIFSKFLIQQSEKERIGGHLERAQELLKEVEGLGTRMQQGGAAEIEKWMGVSLEQQAARGWQAYYQALGQTAEAQAAGQRVAQIEERRRQQGYAARELWESRNRGKLEAWLVQVSAIVAVLAALLGLVSIGLFEAQPAIRKRETIARRTMAWLADFSPSIALIACTAFLLSFLPYARLFTGFREGNPSAINEQLLMARYSELLAVTIKIGGPDTAVLGWTVLTVVLSLVAALLLARMAYRAMHKPAAQA